LRSTAFLELAVEQLVTVGNPLIRNALVLFLWTPYNEVLDSDLVPMGPLSILLKQSVYLIEKIKHAPRDKQLSSTVGLTCAEGVTAMKASGASLAALNNDLTTAANGGSSQSIDVPSMTKLLTLLLDDRPVVTTSIHQSSEFSSAINTSSSKQAYVGQQQQQPQQQSSSSSSSTASGGVRISTASIANKKRMQQQQEVIPSAATSSAIRSCNGVLRLLLQTTKVFLFFISEGPS